MITAHQNEVNEFAGRFQEVLAKKEAFLKSQPASITCQVHPGITRLLDRDASGPETATYSTCPACIAAIKEKKEQQRLHAAGVALNLLHATFGNWRPQDQTEAQHLEIVTEFATVHRRGFLVMLGNVGTGKTHLAVAAMREFSSALFRTQSELLREVRASYRDHAMPDPIARAMQARLLVLDDVGLSGGGKDEFPMLSDILDHRHGEQMPTILTANLDSTGLKALLGARLADRLNESTYRVLTFPGPSHRKDRRSEYFAKP